MEKIQELTDKLLSRRGGKRECRRYAPGGKAKAEADKLVADARKEADEIVDKARKQAQELDANTKSELKLYAGAGFECIEIGDCECRFRQTGKGYGEGAYGQ